jgi:serine/threonine-protein kinase
LLVRTLGRGTFGDVYLANSQNPAATAGQQEVVIKILHAQWAQVPEVVERFRRESLVTQKIEHPHVARVFEHSQLEDGVPFIAMEFLPGKSLRDKLEEGHLTQGQALETLIPICEALAAAHKAGVVHRDLKPENIQIIERNGNPFYPVVLDFGVAKLLDAAEKLTMTGALLGTPIYMSPEQFRGESNLGPPSDVYAFGVLAYELLAGRPPFTGQSFADLAIAHTSASPPPLDSQRFQKPLADLILRCLDKEPEKRPRAESIAQSLRGMLQGLPPSRFVETVVDPHAATSGLSVALAQTVLATSRTADVTARKKRQRTLLVLLAVGVFVTTSAVGLAIYFLLL